MSKTSLLYLVPVCLLSACGGGGGGDKEKINVTDASSAFQASPLSGTTTDFSQSDLGIANSGMEKLVVLDGATVSLKFTSEGVEQTARFDNWSSDAEQTWANVKFKSSDFVWNNDATDIDYKVVRAVVNDKVFNMQGPGGATYNGTINSDIALGAQAIGLKYSDFGYLHVAVKGIYSDLIDGAKTQNFSYFEIFKNGDETQEVGKDEVIAKLGVSDNKLRFTGKAFAMMSGDIRLPTVKEETPTATEGEEVQDVEVVKTTVARSSMNGGQPVLGTAILDIYANMGVDLLLNFSNVTGGGESGFLQRKAKVMILNFTCRGWEQKKSKNI
mgnify:FL=1